MSYDSTSKPIRPHGISSALERLRNTYDLFIFACQLFIRNYFSPPRHYYIMSKQDSLRDVNFRYVNGVSTRNTVRAVSTRNTCLPVYTIGTYLRLSFDSNIYFFFNIYIYIISWRLHFDYAIQNIGPRDSRYTPHQTNLIYYGWTTGQLSFFILAYF